VDFWRQKLIRSYEGGFLEAKVRLQKISHKKKKLGCRKSIFMDSHDYQKQKHY
jgi:hypothetical protein